MPKPARVLENCSIVALNAGFYFQVRTTVPRDVPFPPTLVPPPCRTVWSATDSLDGLWCRSSLLTELKPLLLSVTSISTWTSYLTHDEETACRAETLVASRRNGYKFDGRRHSLIQAAYGVMYCESLAAMPLDTHGSWDNVVATTSTVWEIQAKQESGRRCLA